MKLISRLLIASILSLAAWAQTTISDTIRVPLNNATFTGRIVVSSPEMYFGTTTYARASTSYTITAGVISLSLIPNDASFPAGTTYSVTYYPSTGAASWTEVWYVPTSTPALKVNDVRVRTITSPNVPRLALTQLAQGGATSTQALTWNGSAWAATSLATSHIGAFTTTVRGLLSASAPIVYSTTTGNISCPTCGSGGGGGGTWGTITGTLSDQTDLIGALNAKEASITAGTTAQYWRGDKSFQTLSTSIVPEGTNLYFTNGRVTSAMAGLYESPLTFSAPLARATNTISIPVATGSVNGYLTSTDWTTFNSKEGAITVLSATKGGLGANAATFDGVLKMNGAGVASVVAGSATNCVLVNGSSAACTSSIAPYSVTFTAETSKVTTAATHGQGTTPLDGGCYDGSGQVVGYNTWSRNGSGDVTINFSTAFTGTCMLFNGSGGGGGGGSGTVTSVALTAPSEITVSGSPITTNGTFALTWASQTAGKFLASPSASSGAMSARVIAQADLPVMTGDSGSGGVKGAVPAPGAGDTAAGKYLKADGSWAVPPGGSGAPGGASGQVQFNISAAFAGRTIGAGLVNDGTYLRVDAATVPTYLTTTQSVTVTTTANSYSETNISLAGALTGDAVSLGVPPTIDTGLIWNAYVGATDTVVLRLRNLTGSNITLTGQTFRVWVHKVF